MPWLPNEQQKNEMTIKIKSKGKGWNDKVDKAITHLKKASGKHQAYAVLAAVEHFKDLKRLANAGYAGMTNNAPETIRKAVRNAPDVIAGAREEELAAQQQALAIQQLNNRIDGYLASVSNRVEFTNHRNGGTPGLPIREMVGNRPTVIATHYNNGEGKLPLGGNYIEWYPLAPGGTRSADKRFFTKRSDQNNLWYTEGGTHHGADSWYHQGAPNGAWIQVG
jgi:hypothetical protein